MRYNLVFLIIILNEKHLLKFIIVCFNLLLGNFFCNFMAAELQKFCQFIIILRNLKSFSHSKIANFCVNSCLK